MKAKIISFMDGLIIYDYILFGTVFTLFILFIIFGILLRKRLIMAVVFIILAFCILTLGPTLGYLKMHETIFKNSTKLISQKKLIFTPAVVVMGSMINEAKRDFKSCEIVASAYKVSTNSLKTYVNKLKPFIKMSIMKYDILKGDNVTFKIIIEPFRYDGDYNISLGADCK